MYGKATRIYAVKQLDSRPRDGPTNVLGLNEKKKVSVTQKKSSLPNQLCQSALCKAEKFLFWHSDWRGSSRTVGFPSAGVVVVVVVDIVVVIVVIVIGSIFWSRFGG